MFNHSWSLKHIPVMSVPGGCCGGGCAIGAGFDSKFDTDGGGCSGAGGVAISSCDVKQRVREFSSWGV